MKPQTTRKRRKTFPLEIEDELHKALKYKAIETNQTLHSFIIETLTEKVQEEPAPYAVSRQRLVPHKETKK
jgi:predicted HicB family RNase H-like nuclease